MHNFFRLIDRAGMKQSRVAAAMGVTPYRYTLAKRNMKLPDSEFREAAVRFLDAIGMRNYDGSPYSESDLFSEREAQSA